MRGKAKVDRNQKEIVDALRNCDGVSVAIASAMGKGFPDLIVGYNGINYLIEIKDGMKPSSGQRLTSDQIKFINGWHGQYNVVNSVSAAKSAIGYKNS